MPANIDLLTPKQAAQELGVTTRRVQRFCQEGRLGFKLGGRYIITREGLDSFKKSHSSKPGNPNWIKERDLDPS